MQKRFQFLQFMVTIGGLCLMSATGLADTSCQPKAISDLKRLAPEGYAIYAKATPTFMDWLKCEDATRELSTAVHETVHHLTNEMDAYLLISGKKIPRVPETKAFYQPHLIAGNFDPQSTFVTMYLAKDAASSGIYFRYLLDELNAYTHDMYSSLKLLSLTTAGHSVSHRDGLAALMAFTAVYIDTAKTEYPETWKELQKPKVKAVVSTIWSQAEAVMNGSCKVRNISYEAPTYLAQICAKTESVSKLLGRTTVCPKACLEDKVVEFDDPNAVTATE
jgi:hypothetical protein